MSTLDTLQSRISSSRLTGPAPSEAVMEQIFKSALRAADHANLRPWRFLVLSGQDLNRLGDLFAEISIANDADISDEAVDKARKKPLRAPLILVAIARCQQHPKVPEIEQILSTGAAVQNMLNAAYAQGVGAIWRTGPMAYDRRVMHGLGLAENEKIVGFIYMGTPEGKVKTTPKLNVEDFFGAWKP